MSNILTAAVSGFVAGLASRLVITPTPTGGYEVRIKFPRLVSSRAVSVGTDPIQLVPDREEGLVYVKSDSSNSDRVFLGLPPVSRDTGYQLGVGEEVMIAVSNLNSLFAVSNAGFQRLKVLVFG